jgi:hypothetical protein
MSVLEFLTTDLETAPVLALFIGSLRRAELLALVDVKV